ncbi:MAG: hypothetical protein H7X86_09690 [Gorillibacterium sp.]|nr:hypothetical protein [Gorillibacterium sp.]
MEPFAKPMGVGAILDRSFQIYRKHFILAFASILILLGPGYFLMQYFTYQVNAHSQNEYGFGSSWLDSSGASGMSDQSYGVFALVMLLIIPLYMLVFGPPVISTQLHLTRAASQNQNVSLGKLLKNSFVHYWPALGNSLLFGLVMIGIYMGIVIVVVIVFIIIGLLTSLIGVGLFQFDFNILGTSIILIALAVIIYALFISGIIILLGYFVMRLGFYLAAIFLNHDRHPFKRSWRLTKGNFWRIFSIYLVMTLVFMVFNTQIYIFTALVKMPLLGQLVNALIGMLIMPMQMIAYGVTYLDLLVRREGTDVEQMLKLGYGNAPTLQTPDGTIGGTKLGDDEDGYPRG